jgi:hypothetical protein
MKKLTFNQKYALFVVIVLISTSAAMGVNTLGSTTSDATIIGANTWQGGDLQIYYNATINFNGHIISHVFSCTYFKIGDKISLTESPIGGYAYNSLPKGC